eukprot:gene27240-35784_t
MFPLSDFFPFRVDDFPVEQRQITLCLERQLCSSSHFVFLYLLLRNIRSISHSGNSRVLIISANHDFNHYKCILKKQNMDVDKLISTGRLEFIYLRFDAPSSSSFYSSMGREMSWDQLESWLQQESTTTSATPLDLMIDDLELLEQLAPSAAAARKFLSACIYRMMQQSIGSQKLE